jgi:hypothetical protein
MPIVNFVKKIKISDSFLFKSVCDKYDLNVVSYEKKWDFSFEFPLNWKIGLIVGDSGSGKSITAKHLFPKVYENNIITNVECPLVDNFQNHTLNEIANAFTSVGLGSIPEWINCYSSLSTGQRMRADLAACILSNEQLIVYDEFTSVVDRQVAKTISHSIAKAFRKTTKQFVAITCHSDIEDWICPDWVLDMNLKELRCEKKKRPNIELNLFSCSRKIWKFFQNHHYLNHDLPSSAMGFCATINYKLCAFISLSRFQHPITKNMLMINRVVVLPEYQGFGIAKIMMNELSNFFYQQNNRIRIVTSHIAMIRSLKPDPNWKLVRIGRVGRPSPTSNQNSISNSRNRLTCAFEYCPQTTRIIA